MQYSTIITPFEMVPCGKHCKWNPCCWNEREMEELNLHLRTAAIATNSVVVIMQSLLPLLFCPLSSSGGPATIDEDLEQG